MGDLYAEEESSRDNIVYSVDPIRHSITNDTPPYNTHNTTIIIEEGGYYLFNMMILSVFALGLIGMCCKSLSRARQYINESRQSSSLNNYLLSHQVQEGGVEGTCSICIEAFTSSQANIVLQCNHKFHSHCIKEWLEKELICPNCRAPINI